MRELEAEKSERRKFKTVKDREVESKLEIKIKPTLRAKKFEDL
jgi:hypothetical protein